MSTDHRLASPAKISFNITLRVVRLGAYGVRGLAQALDAVASVALEATSKAADRDSARDRYAVTSEGVGQSLRVDAARPTSSDAAPSAPIDAQRRTPASSARAAHGGAAIDGGLEVAHDALAPHIDVEQTFVADSADPGAVDGAGAELHVEPPWEGYESFRAREVIDQLVAQSDAALSLLVLYERRSRARRTVLAAAERELARRQQS